MAIGADHAARRRRLPRAAAFTIPIAALLVAVATYLGISLVVADQFTHPDRKPIARAPLVSAPRYEDVRFRTSDGLTLSGWFFPHDGDRAAIVVHGRSSNRIQSDLDDIRRGEHIADFFIAHGFAVLLFDLRGHGNSDGDRYSFGYYERRDVAAAIEFMTGRGYAERRVALLGVSLGAGSVVQVLELHPGIGPIVTDSLYSDIEVVLHEQLETATHGVPGWFTPGVMLAASVELGVPLGAVRPIAFVRAHPERAFLFIHCSEDEMVALHQAYDLKAASANPGTQLWIPSGCQHAQGYERDPVAYQSHVLAFVEAQLR
jgi:fermentation-respiration switch protein FrsA (DUF1100 family)